MLTMQCVALASRRWLQVLGRISRSGGRCVRCYHTRECFGHSWRPAREYEVPAEWVRNRAAQPNLWRLVTAYRDHGHRKADIDPLKARKRDFPLELHLASYGLEGQKDELFSTEGLVFGLPGPQARLSDIVAYLERTYCESMTLEAAHVTSTAEREWLLQKYEELRHMELPPERREGLGATLAKCQAFEHFLAKKFQSLKRYGVEGAESIMGFFEQVFQSAGEGGVKDIVVGMAHRGKLNVLTNVLQIDPTHIFHKIQGNLEHADNTPSIGDVLTHLVGSVDLDMGDGRSLHVSLLPCPSHLESVNPMALGKVRAKHLCQSRGPYQSNGKGTGIEEMSYRDSKVLCLQVHGDGAFSAQGVVMESLALAYLPHFDVGGTVHLITNNQLGFTAEADHGRSSLHCSDVAKMTGCPVIHVNGDNPEEVVRATRIAMEYWLEFRKDVLVDLVCFRRRGHNELDNPSLTQPLLYDTISNRLSVPDLYTEELVSSGVSSQEKLSSVVSAYTEDLNQRLKETEGYSPPATHLQGNWRGMEWASEQITEWDTGCPIDLLKYVGAKSVEVSPALQVHPRLREGHMAARVKSLEDETPVNWATAEALAIGTLLYQGFDVRLSGQDVGRGTFSHRHAMVTCQESDAAYIPLNHLSDNQTAFLEVVNNPLSEEAVVGFEYGFSTESPSHLVIWEAQFGDFFNGAQIMIDTMVSAGEAKWLLQSGLVMLLPHGYDGAGPEHSSCRIERFLQLCDSSERGPNGDSVNMQVTHPTTPAQYYHLLRRQMVRNFRKPLIVASPKVILRHPAAVSSLQDMGPGTTFQPVLTDPLANPQEVTRVVLCSGKHYYALDAYRRKKGVKDTAIIRVELLCPFPSAYIYRELSRYPNAKGFNRTISPYPEFIWSQEEQENMGPWGFVEPRVRKQLNHHLSFVGRKPSAAPAVGVEKIHAAEVEKLLTDTFPHV